VGDEEKGFMAWHLALPGHCQVSKIELERCGENKTVGKGRMVLWHSVNLTFVNLFVNYLRISVAWGPLLLNNAVVNNTMEITAVFVQPML